MTGWLRALALAAAAAAAAAPEVVISTSMGDMRLRLYPDDAPETVANFLRYVDEG